MTEIEIKVAEKGGYKKTKLGLIPDEWELLKLSKICKITSGGTPKRDNPDYWNGDIPWITTTLIDFNELYSAEEFITKKGLKNSSAKLFDPGTILVALYGQGVTRGKSSLLKIKAATNQACAALIPSEKILSEFLFQMLIFHYERLRWNSNDGSQKNLSGRLLKNYSIPVPSHSEQKLLSEILTTWDEAIAKTEKLIQAKKRYKKGLMQRLLSGKVRFPEFEGEDWVDVKLGSLLREVKRMDDWDDEKLYELISVRRRSGGIFHRENLYGHEIKTKKLKEVKTGDFLISRMQIVHGASAVVTPEFENLFVSNSYHTLVKRKGVELNMSFFNYLSQLPYFYHLTYISSYGVHIEKMTFNLKDFLKKKVRMPKTEAEQHKIASVLQQADKEIDLLKEQKQNIEKQKKGLMQQLLTGKVRVKHMETGSN